MYYSGADAVLIPDSQDLYQKDVIGILRKYHTNVSAGGEALPKVLWGTSPRERERGSERGPPPASSSNISQVEPSPSNPNTGHRQATWYICHHHTTYHCQRAGMHMRTKKVPDFVALNRHNLRNAHDPPSYFTCS
jgi:hypothetical protein